MGIGWSTGIIGAAATEHLTLGQKLGVNLQPDDGLIVHDTF
jgi:hypothetical protein